MAVIIAPFEIVCSQKFGQIMEAFASHWCTAPQVYPAQSLQARSSMTLLRRETRFVPKMSVCIKNDTANIKNKVLQPL